MEPTVNTCGDHYNVVTVNSNMIRQHFMQKMQLIFEHDLGMSLVFPLSVSGSTKEVLVDKQELRHHCIMPVLFSVLLFLYGSLVHFS